MPAGSPANARDARDAHRGRARSRAPVTLVLVSILTILAAATAHARALPGRFDYYALSLSWSPTFCRSDAGRRAYRQCNGVRPYAFVVHGLWPQYRRGWPQYCAKRRLWLANRLIESMYDIMPSKRLIIHEWKKHGSCSGLEPGAYFALLRTLFERVRIPARYLRPNRAIITTPEEMSADFVKTNRKLTAAMLSIHCGNRKDRARLAEVRICFDRAGNFVACGHNERRRCRARQLVLPPVRGTSP